MVLESFFAKHTGPACLCVCTLVAILALKTYLENRCAAASAQVALTLMLIEAFETSGGGGRIVKMVMK